jgi:hypothetical protein
LSNEVSYHGDVLPGLCDSRDGIGPRHGPICDLLEQAALEGSTTTGAMQIDGATLPFQGAAGLHQQLAWSIVVLFDLQAQCFQHGSFAMGKLDVGEERTIAAEAATGAEVFGQSWFHR